MRFHSSFVRMMSSAEATGRECSFKSFGRPASKLFNAERPIFPDDEVRLEALVKIDDVEHASPCERFQGRFAARVIAIAQKSEEAVYLLDVRVDDEINIQRHASMPVNPTPVGADNHERDSG